MGFNSAFKGLIDWLLGAFKKLRKSTISFVMSVCQSDRTEQHGCHWTDIHEILHFGYFSKKKNLLRKFRLLLKSDKNNGTVHEDRYKFLVVSRSVLPRMRKVTNKVLEKTEVQNICSTNFFFFRKLCRVWDNVEKYGRGTDHNMTHAHYILDK